MLPAEILADVNGYKDKHCPAFGDVEYQGNDNGLIRSHQELMRKSVLPQEFELIHLWVALKNEAR
jgi:hypothetical protein